ncbi:MAG TPA: hypothetical protein PLB89_05075 [Flavobacteriales bacterium]|nr:hypothetical protein [Flavobacteriales bacterium]
MFIEEATKTLNAIRERRDEIVALRPTDPEKADSLEQDLLYEFVQLIEKRAFAPFKGIAAEIMKLKRTWTTIDDPLYACPCCERTGFTERGLRAHRCDAKPKRREKPTGPLVRPQLGAHELLSALSRPIKTPQD